MTGRFPPMTHHPRQRSDSIAASVAAQQAIRTSMAPPEPLPNTLLPIWQEVVEMRASFEWSSLDLRLAVSLVRALGDLASQERQLSREAKVQQTPHGPVVNPRFAIIDRLSARILKLQTRLLLTPRAAGLKADRTEHQRRVEREARARVDPIGAYLDNGGDAMSLLLGAGDGTVVGDRFLARDVPAASCRPATTTKRSAAGSEPAAATASHNSRPLTAR